MRKKVVTYLNLVRNRRLTTDNQIYLTNMVLNAHVTYVAEARLREVYRFSISAEELVDLHFHYPTRTLTVFTDVYYGKGSHRNRKFSIPIQPVSTLAELHAIEEALLSAPSGVNLCGHTVTYQHVYSHIPDKKRLARAAGPKELTKLKYKLHSMKDRLWGALPLD
ncbi:uncharacterized protein ACA1_121300 [Acanthamoeba castellanii str. Neff]|uniref:Uncharacterized protein n=1 Tax=Acanthamoeba castellanii (strain ATCC 30010 / Neff) TaxID=1257118 RepID=L8GFC1_ACACF|nr:uncharacterized protein ACA1_121300 [Acanthamoeba castellanii str. Neff]ELR11433.1 hypothetical protein ACA1_121300 [Acanthamoeba castellanii str. Neff]